MGSLTDEQRDVYASVVEFVGRQTLVHRVLRQFRPHLVPEPGERPPLPSKEQASATQRGYWGEWHYRIHGGGCELIHATTGEPIQWDSPDLHRFDPNWFIDWVQWRGASRGAGAIDPMEVRRVLGELAQLGLLRHHPDRTNSYELLLVK